MNQIRRKNKKPTRRISSQRRVSLSWRKKLGFSTLTLVAFCVAVEFGLFLLGVQPIIHTTDPYVGFSNQVPLFSERVESGRTVVETAKSKLSFFNYQKFEKEKGRDTYRIFCLGGSTTYGRPYDDTTSFAGWLRELLPTASPDRKWEVINAGGISYASYRVVRVMEELASYGPDLFIVYTGHNEFLEERTYRELRNTPGIIREIGGVFSRTRSYSVLHRMLRSGNAKPNKPETPDESELTDEVQTRLDSGVGPDAYERDELLASKVAEHFEYNLNQMITIARAAGAEIICVTPASNLANCSPFKSQFADGFSQQSEWQRAFDAAKQALEQERFDAALESAEVAVSLASEHAETIYLYGRVLENLSQYDQALDALTKARDLDVCPLRALSPLTEAVRRVCRDADIPFVDFEKTVADASSHGIPGASLFLDHVHPTIAGNRILALQLFDWLVGHNIVRKPADWDARVNQVVGKVEAKIDRHAHGEALRNLSKVLMWAGKKDDANRLALQAAELIENDTETIYLAGNALLKEGKIDAAIQKFKEALRIDPNFILALNSLGAAEMRRHNLDAAVSSFQRVVKLKPDFAPAHNNLGTLYQKRRDDELAIQHFKEAIRLNPRYSMAYNNVAVLLRTQQKYDEAEGYLRKALSINAGFAEAHFNLGKTLELKGNAASAESEYTQALRLNSNYSPAHVSLGALYEKQERWQAAAKAYQNATRPPTPSLDAGRRLAWLLATCPDPKMRNGKVALQIATQCADATKHRQSSVLSALAAAHAELGDFQAAVKWQTEALAHSTPETRGIHAARLEVLRNGRPLRSP